VGAPVNLYPWTLTFAALAVGVNSGPKTATLTNVGPGTVTIDRIASSGDFSETNNCPKSIAAGASCTITVIFRPSVTGIRSGSVSILDLLHSSPQILGLAGLGLPAQ
jgi:hypothetical protein